MQQLIAIFSSLFIKLIFSSDVLQECKLNTSKGTLNKSTLYNIMLYPNDLTCSLDTSQYTSELLV